MNFNITKLVEHILREETAAPAGSSGDFSGVIGPTTAQDGNTSIDYIPGGLKKKKKKDELKEQLSAEIHSSYAKMMRVLAIDLRENKSVKRTIYLLNYWLHIFPKSQYLPLSNEAVLDLGNYDKSVVKLLDRIKNIYAEDVGSLQMLYTAIREDRPLNAFAPFSDYDYIVGVRVQTEYEKIRMVLEMTINTALVPTNTLYIESQDTLDELKAYRTIKVVKNTVFPVGQFFQPSIFSNIRNIIDDLEEINS